MSIAEGHLGLFWKFVSALCQILSILSSFLLIFLTFSFVLVLCSFVRVPLTRKGCNFVRRSSFFWLQIGTWHWLETFAYSGMHEILREATVWNHFHKISSPLLKLWISQHYTPDTSGWDSAATTLSVSIKQVCVASFLLCAQPGGGKWSYRLTWDLIHVFQ